MNKVKIHRKIAKLTNLDMFYMDTQTEGKTIVCLHGRYGRAEIWVDFIQQYGYQYRIIAPDQRGHGLSGKPISKYTAEEMVTDIIELLDLLGIKNVILVGHSMGGRIAGYMANLYPNYVSALAILDKSPDGNEEPNKKSLDQIPLTDPLTKDWPLPFQSLTEARIFITKQMETDISSQYFLNSLVESVEGYSMMFSSQAIAANIAYEQNWYHLLPEIKCLVLIVRSSSHEAVPNESFEKMKSMLPNCLAFEVSHPSHNVHLGNKEEFYKYFNIFLQKVD